MRYSIVALFGPFLVKMVSACYGSGDSAVEIRQTGLNGVANYCKAIQGYFAGGQARYKCVSEAKSKTAWIFNFQNVGKNGMTLTYKHCEDSIKSQINDCSKGGDKTVNWWFFRADPQPGSCSDQEYINDHPNGESSRARRGVGSAANSTDEGVTVYDLKYLPSHEELHSPLLAERSAESKEQASEVYDLKYLPSHEELHSLPTTRRGGEESRQVASAFQA